SRERSPSRRIVAIVRSFRLVWGEKYLVPGGGSVDRGEPPGRLSLRGCPGDADATRADEVDDAVRTAQLVERVHLLGRARELEHDRVGPDVEEPPAERLGSRDHLGAPPRGPRGARRAR